MKYIKKFKTLLEILPELQYGIFLKKIPRPLVPFIVFISRVLLGLIPTRLYRLIPKSLSFLILTSANWLNLRKLIELKPTDLRIDLRNQIAIEDFFRTCNYLDSGEIPELVEITRYYFTTLRLTPLIEQKIMKLINWAVWHASHEDMEKIVTSIVNILNDCSQSDTSKADTKVRFLRDFSSNMGHLALLFLYIKQYRDTTRTLMVPSRKPANEFFLNLVIDRSPLEVLIDQNTNFNELSICKVDTFQYSLNGTGKFKLEPEGISFPKDRFLEYDISSDFLINLDASDSERGAQILNEYLGYTPDWFAVLHVREPVNGNIRFSQARDANISSYDLLANSIRKLGGLVIRMGDERFPKLPTEFLALDYAHSSFRSDFMDVWLWANCKFWVGNINGAAFPPICFGKPRLLTNQWHWYLHGPSHDFVLRKNIVKTMNSNTKCSAKEIMESRCSRIQDRGWLNRMGYSVMENSRHELKEAFEMFYNYNFEDKSIYKSREKTTEICYLESVLGGHNLASTMKLIN